jgi:hypothetical protein
VVPEPVVVASSIVPSCPLTLEKQPRRKLQLELQHQVAAEEALLAEVAIHGVLNFTGARIKSARVEQFAVGSKDAGDATEAAGAGKEVDIFSLLVAKKSADTVEHIKEIRVEFEASTTGEVWRGPTQPHAKIVSPREAATVSFHNSSLEVTDAGKFVEEAAVQRPLIVGSRAGRSQRKICGSKHEGSIVARNAVAIEIIVPDHRPGTAALRFPERRHEEIARQVDESGEYDRVRPLEIAPAPGVVRVSYSTDCVGSEHSGRGSCVATRSRATIVIRVVFCPGERVGKRKVDGVGQVVLKPCCPHNRTGATVIEVDQYLPEFRIPDRSGNVGAGRIKLR